MREAASDARLFTLRWGPWTATRKSLGTVPPMLTSRPLPRIPVVEAPHGHTYASTRVPAPSLLPDEHHHPKTFLSEFWLIFFLTSTWCERPQGQVTACRMNSGQRLTMIRVAGKRGSMTKPIERNIVPTPGADSSFSRQTGSIIVRGEPPDTTRQKSTD